MYDEIINISNQIKAKIGDIPPKIGVILGSGLGDFADLIENPIIIDYEDVEGFPKSTVTGHAGKLIYGDIAGEKVLCMQGRLHLYEGHHPSRIALVMHVFKELGVENMIVTNASGSLNIDCPPGNLVLINDHINFSFQNPMVGPNDKRVGQRFFDMCDAYSLELREKMHKAAKAVDIDLREGVYMMVMGPNFETPAEIRAFKTLGADVIGMSTVPDVLACVHAGIKVVAVATVTNFGAGMENTCLSHAETLSQAEKVSEKLQKLVVQFIKEMN